MEFAMAKEKKNEAFGFAIAALRRASYRWPANSEALKRARIARNEYICNICKGVFGRREVQKDHIEPVVPTTGWRSFDDFIERLYCKVENIQIACKQCHRAKSKLENELRRKNTKEKLSGDKGNKKEAKKITRRFKSQRRKQRDNSGL
jgi:5-methylcytosine-specific restriction endonuclease McrA